MIWLEVLLGTIPIVFGIWQLIDLRRERRRDEAKRALAKSSEKVVD